jgi:hypothetical protein
MFLVVLGLNMVMQSGRSPAAFPHFAVRRAPEARAIR